MSSTDATPDVGCFYDDVMIPLGERLHSEQGPLFPRAPDAAVATYFAPTMKQSFAPSDFELPKLNDPSEVQSSLERMWMDSGRSELAPLAATFGKWVAMLQQQGPESSEVSALVYVMY